jgi:hypothetical protein
MSDDAEVSMVLYTDLLQKEKKVLKGVENGIVKLLITHGFTSRPFWTSRTDGKKRFLKLHLSGSPQPVFELPANELIKLSGDELLSRFNKSVGQYFQMEKNHTLQDT